MDSSERTLAFNKLKQLTKTDNQDNNNNNQDWNKTETHIKKEFPNPNLMNDNESEILETEELTTPKILSYDRPQVSPRTKLYFPIEEKPKHYTQPPNTRTGIIKKGSNNKKKAPKKKPPPKKKKLKPLKINGDSYDENDLFDFQSETEQDYDFEEKISRPQKKVEKNHSIDDNDESSEVKSVIEFYDSLDIDYGTAQRDLDIIKRVRKLFNAVTVEKANKVLTKSVNIRVNTSIQVILQHLDDVNPWVGHVYDGQKHVGQLDTYDIAAFLTSIYPKSNSHEELIRAGNMIQERNAGDLIKSQKAKPFRCKLSTPLLDLVYGLDRKGKNTSAVVAEYDQEFIPTIGLIGLLNLVYQEVSDIPSVSAQPVGEFSIFSDKIAILPSSTKMNVVLAVMVESRHNAVAIINDQGSLIAEFKPRDIKSINVSTYSLMTLTAQDFIQNTSKMVNKPPVAVPLTRFDEALRMMVTEGRESLWVVDDRSSNIPLGVIDSLNILRYLCMRVQKKPLSGTWRYRTKVEEQQNDPNFWNLLFHQQAIKQGFMEIYIPSKKKYIQRFFMLKSNIIIHFPQVNNMRMLDKTQHIHPLTNYSVENHGATDIVLIDSKRQFRLKCKTEIERNEWSKLIRLQTSSLPNNTNN